MALRVVVAILFMAIAFECGRESVSADHNVYLPYTPNTPLMQKVIQQQEYVWCLDQRTATYPNFRNQLTDVVDRYFERTGIKHRETNFSDPACMVKHTMPQGITCDGWAGRIYYANNPVEVQYCYSLGYVDWRSTQGHELGHGLLGLHEQYRDSGGSIACTSKQWTVMDCGSGVRYPQSIDVERGCSLISTAWCGQQPSCSISPPNQDGLRWDSCRNLWLGEFWDYNPLVGEWFDKSGVSEWCCQADYGGKYNRRLELWSWTKITIWHWQGGPWVCAEGCP